jgi:hypothetical protein
MLHRQIWLSEDPGENRSAPQRISTAILTRLGILAALSVTLALSSPDRSVLLISGLDRYSWNILIFGTTSHRYPHVVNSKDHLSTSPIQSAPGPSKPQSDRAFWLCAASYTPYTSQSATAWGLATTSARTSHIDTNKIRLAAWFLKTTDRELC